MSLKPDVKKRWVEFQKKNSVPVNALGIKIKDSDNATLKIWKEEGIDKFMKK